MTRFLKMFWVPILGALLLLTACETSEQKRAVAGPPAPAQAPTLPDTASSSATSSSPSVWPRASKKNAASVDPIEATVAAAEKEYQAGRANYAAGHMQAAKDNFDRAFDLLLTGPAQIKSDDRLQQEFDKIVEETHQLELLALKAGDGFTERRSEPAPIDEANEVTFPVDPGIKAKAAQELKTTQSDLPLTMNDAVAAYINYFSSRGRGFLEHGYVRSGRYREMILRTLREEGVPQDLIYLAQAESGFQPLALSQAGARGMWQFMASRGTQYGLSRNWWVDERLDPVKSTRAAAHHLKDLYNQFGDWYLAMAAYNSGPGTVQRAVERTGYADYWELHRRGALPAETRNYVPIILAITIMSKNPAQYGLDRLTQEPVLRSETVTIHYPVDLRLVAECVDSSANTLQELNPGLLRLTTPKDQAFDLRLPLGTTDKFQTAIAAIPEDMRVLWRYHRVTRGETLSAIARQYHTSESSIQEVNRLNDGDLRVDSRLVIPISPVRHEASAPAFSRRTERYRVHKGDSVASVADELNVPIENLRKWNHLNGNTLAAGRTLLVYRPVTSSSSSSSSRDNGAVADPPAPSSRSGRRTSTRASSRANKSESADRSSEKSSGKSGKSSAKSTDKGADKTSAKSNAKSTGKSKQQAASPRDSARTKNARRAPAAADSVEKSSSKHGRRSRRS